jgi:hypothetical protein
LARPGEVLRTLRAGRDVAWRSRDDDEHEEEARKNIDSIFSKFSLSD